MSNSSRKSIAHSLKNAVRQPMGRWKITGKSVLGVLLLTIVAQPFLMNTDFGVVVEGILTTMILFFGVLAIGGKRRTFITAIALAVPTVAAKWLNHSFPELVPADVFLSFGVLIVGYVVWNFLKFVMSARRVDSHVLCTGIATFLLLGLLWAFLYQLIDKRIPGSFSWPGAPAGAPEMRGGVAVYFSLVTLCTVGFGDVLPVTPIARMCAMLEGVTGVFFVAVLISRLVSLYTVTEQQESTGRDAEGT